MLSVEQPTILAIWAALFGATPSCAGCAQAAKLVPDCEIAFWNNPIKNYFNLFSSRDSYFIIN